MDDKTLDLNQGDDEPIKPQRIDAASELSRKIGHYRLIRLIGEGGMGQVYEAEQVEPLKRKVALKIVKRGMDTNEFVARFDSERQALALMDHPAIATVYDAGTTEGGRPYFVMEYVEGEPLIDYCDRKRLTIRQRLELFVHVCEGVQHAHQKIIIHRDLKPSNVLVTEIDGNPIPKIIDFGVAKVTDSSVFDNTMSTFAGQLIGTPQYMSPEQADATGQGIDIRVDVYALGVILYELLVGQLPFPAERWENIGLSEMLRIIREEEPPPPSFRAKELLASGELFDAIAAGRRLDPSALAKSLRGDLDWITMRALEKDRTRRYETVMGLSVDVQRHLKDIPISARPPSKVYTTKKFIRRHRTGVMAGGFVVLAVLLGIVGTTTGMIRAVRAERAANQEAETATKVTDFLVNLFEVSDPDHTRGNTITAREILDQGSERISKELAGQPETGARLMNTIGKVYMNLGLYDEAEPKLSKAVDLRRSVTGANDPRVAGFQADLADLYIDQGRYPEAQKMLEQALTKMESSGKVSELKIADSMNELAGALRRQGEYDAAQPLYERAREIRVKELGKDDPAVASSDNSLAILNWNKGQFDQAERLYKQALSIWENAYGENHSDVAKGLNNLALLYHHLERYDEAIPLYLRAIKIYEKILGPEHPRLALALNNLALAYSEQKNYPLARKYYERALAIREKVLGSDHPDVAQTLNNLANLDRDQGQYATAESLYHRALAIRTSALGADHPDVAWSLRDLGVLAADRGRFAVADSIFTKATGILTAALGPKHPDLAEVLDEHAATLAKLGERTAADSLRSRAAAIRADNP